MLPRFIISLLIFVALISCTEQEVQLQHEPYQGNVVISEENCIGSYYGPEFEEGKDVAHQFSNRMSKVIGDELKERYTAGNYTKVDLNNIEMTTAGMGTGDVHYELIIPFVKVADKCDAYTSFDHCGGWNHAPELDKRISQLEKALLPSDQLNISELKTTKEGLQEYWIQWRNKEVQAKCEHSK